MSKQFWAVIIAIVVIFGGIIALNGNKSSDTSKAGGTLTNHIEGSSGTSEVTLVEYGDYQCRFCIMYFPTVEAVQQKYANVKFQFRNFPLTNLHPNAFAAARAAEAAGLQNKYFEMHDLLYQNADENSATGWTASQDPTKFFDQYAKQLKLDMTKYKADYSSSKVNDLINGDYAEGTRLKVTGTPSFFINGKKTDIANSPDAFSKVIDAALAKQKPASGGTTEQTPATTPETPATETTPADTTTGQ